MTVKTVLKKCLSTKDKISACSVVLLSALLVILLVPILARNVPNALIIGLMALFIVSVMPRVSFLYQGDRVTLILLAVCMAIETAYKLLGISSAALYYYFNTVQFFFFLGSGIMIYSSLTLKQTKILLHVSVGTMLFTMLHNYFLFVKYGAREYVSLFQTEKYATNSMNTPYVSAIMLLAGLALICGMLHKGWKIKIPAFLVFAVGFLFIVCVAQRMTVLILAVLMYAMILLIQLFALLFQKCPKWIGVVCLVLLVIGVVLLCINILPILRFIRGKMDSKRLVDRINQIIRLIKTGDISEARGSLTVRYELIKTSWDTFTSSASNMLFGAGDHRVTNEIVGNHSFIVDELARYGMVFATPMFCLVLRAMSTVRKMSSVKKGTVLSYHIGVLAVIVIMRAAIGAIFDPAIGVSLFLIVPLTFRVISEKQI